MSGQSGLAYTVHVVGDDGVNTVAFGPDSPELPDWALEKIGDHAFEGGVKPKLKNKSRGKDKDKGSTGDNESGSKGDGGSDGGDPAPLTLEAYMAETKSELEKKVADRNKGRDDDALIEVEAPGNKAELAAALVADDKAQASA